MRRSKLVTVAVLLGCVSLALAAREFTVPRAANAKTYPAHDAHANEQVTIAVDPYDMPGKAGIFKTKWREYGILPMHVIVSNDGDGPVALTGIKVELVTRNRSKIMPATDDDLYRRVSKVKRRGDEPSRNPLPVPLPRRGPEVGVSKDTREELEAAQFRAVAVEPHSTRAGFLFFDVQGISTPLAGARLYVSGLRDNNGQELMFFEIPLEKYLSAPAQPR
ncbi:MAG: hypothetical protein ACE14L_17560 [Terriglobales bacterium]